MTHYERFLEKITDEMFDEAYRQGLTWIGLAHRAGLAESTVYKLGMRITRFPQLRTFFLLAKAVRMNVRVIRKELARHESKAESKTSAAAHGR
jgi:hypothetical protein